jgi:hypothetical protein
MSTTQILGWSLIVLFGLGGPGAYLFGVKIQQARAWDAMQELKTSIASISENTWREPNKGLRLVPDSAVYDRIDAVAEHLTGSRPLPTRTWHENEVDR